MLLDVQIRWLIRVDQQTVLDIEKECFQHPWGEDDLLQRMRQRNRIGMVAETDNNRIAGYMVYEFHKETLHLLRFGVAPWARRQKVGSQLIQRLTDKLTQQRRREIITEVAESNLDAQLFFQKCGFRAVEVFPQWYPLTNEDAFFFVYKLRGWSQPLPKFQWRNRISEYAGDK